MAKFLSSFLYAQWSGFSFFIHSFILCHEKLKKELKIFKKTKKEKAKRFS
jgi:hypothetical protein